MDPGNVPGLQCWRLEGKRCGMNFDAASSQGAYRGKKTPRVIPDDQGIPGRAHLGRIRIGIRRMMTDFGPTVNDNRATLLTLFTHSHRHAK